MTTTEAVKELERELEETAAWLELVAAEVRKLGGPKLGKVAANHALLAVKIEGRAVLLRTVIGKAVRS